MTTPTTGNDFITGSDSADIIDPLAGDDIVLGLGGTDTIFASPGDDEIYGGNDDPGPSLPEGYVFDGFTDTVIYQAARANVLLTSEVKFHGFWGQMFPFWREGWATESELEGRDELLGVERLIFADGEAIALDFGGLDQSAPLHAREAAKLVGALFGPQALSNEYLVGIFLAGLDLGMTGEAIAQASFDFLGVSSHEAVVRLVWDNLVDFPIIDSYLAEFVAVLDGGMSAAHFAVLASETTYNTDNVRLTGSHPDGTYLYETGLPYLYYPV